MDHKQLMLHELLRQEQEPFHLNAYISDKRSRLNYSSPKPPFTHFLHVPSSTAALLLEAAFRIQKHRPKTNTSLFRSFFKILKHRSKNKVMMSCDLKENENSCSCMDDHGNIGDFELQKLAPFCCSPFRFSLHKCPSSSHRHTPEFFSPATSLVRRVNQEKCVEEEKEQCSPVCVLDSFLEDESIVEVDDDDDLERSYAYAKIQRARQKLMERLRRFENFASTLEAVEVEVEEEEYEKGGGVEYEDEEVKHVDMVEMMVKSELDEWKICAEETAAEIELAILCGLMQEISE